MTAARTRAIVVAALAAAAGCTAFVVTSDHLEGQVVWTVFGPAVGLSFVGTGLYAQRRRPESRVGTLMVLFGFAWLANAAGASNSPLRVHGRPRSPAGCGAGCSSTSS